MSADSANSIAIEPVFKKIIFVGRLNLPRLLFTAGLTKSERGKTDNFVDYCENLLYPKNSFFPTFNILVSRKLKKIIE